MAFAQRDYYIPKALLTPLHDQKGQLQIAAGWGGGANLQVSYAATNHLAVFSTVALDPFTHTRTTLFSRYKQNNNNYVLQGGAGYFGRLNYRRLNRIEVYTGVGIQDINSSWYFVSLSESEEYTRARYWTAFSQLNIGKTWAKGELVFGLRLAYSRYLDFSYYDDHPNSRAYQYRYEQLQGVTLEPAVSYGYHWKRFKLTAQGGIAAPVFVPQARLHTTQRTDTTPLLTVGQEQVPLAALLGRISLHYQFGPKTKGEVPAQQKAATSDE
ncbi:hypothetical protein H8B15_01970 [Hymenobacter sp. BT507]|uniref:Outer membrane protein beta-barrel domain-containing protein n=1 Tax=Hymenobacter citatus TaxID=2763506 RepID=A0ABR7MG12_9BACT|nr:hypothetical protein [Hymenobacter citatus]MBC6609670.1 hypothetical protein [Hymenobacter citatus]